MAIRLWGSIFFSFQFTDVDPLFSGLYFYNIVILSLCFSLAPWKIFIPHGFYTFLLWCALLYFSSCFLWLEYFELLRSISSFFSTMFFFFSWLLFTHFSLPLSCLSLWDFVHFFFYSLLCSLFWVADIAVFYFINFFLLQYLICHLQCCIFYPCKCY